MKLQKGKKYRFEEQLKLNLIIIIVLYLFVNAIFINEEYISELFYSKNESFF